MHALRRFLLYAFLSYRALFTWLNPWGYVSTRITVPVMIALLFGTIGRYLGTGVAKPAVGAAMLAIAIATVYGVNLAVANELTFGTLSGWLIAPQGLLTGLAGKSVVHIADAILGAAITLGTAMVAFSLHISAAAVFPLLCCALCAALSSSALGIAVAAVSLRFRDVFTAPNIAESILMVGSGAIVAPSKLPAHLGVISTVLPLTHAVQATHTVLETARLPIASVGWELLVGGIWGVLGYGLLHRIASGARTRGAYDLI